MKIQVQLGTTYKTVDVHTPLKTDTPEINRLRNILAALINLKNQCSDPNEDEKYFMDICENWIYHCGAEIVMRRPDLRKGKKK